MTARKVTIGTRGSALALKQTEMVKAALLAQNPDLDIDVHIIVTTGDRRTDVPLDQVARVAGIADKGVFLKEIEHALETGEIDFAVHSLKDMPSALDPKFQLSAVLPRAQVDDVLIRRADAPAKISCVATGSVRRRYMGQRYWDNDTQFVNIRGNVTTRLTKLVESTEFDAMILAKAGLDRLGLYATETEWQGVPITMQPLPKEHFVPAAGQGVIGIETRIDDAETQHLLQSINHEPTFRCIRAEREFLRLLGADCSTPIGAYAYAKEGAVSLHILLFTEDGKPPFQGFAMGTDPEGLAHQLWESYQASQSTYGA
jgi:hydroxymethylbilane synthase